MGAVLGAYELYSNSACITKLSSQFIIRLSLALSGCLN